MTSHRLERLAGGSGGAGEEPGSRSSCTGPNGSGCWEQPARIPPSSASQPDVGGDGSKVEEPPSQRISDMNARYDAQDPVRTRVQNKKYLHYKNFALQKLYLSSHPSGIPVSMP